MSIEEFLREALTSRANEIRARGDAWTEAEERLKRRRLRSVAQRAAVVTLTLSVSIGTFVGLWALFRPATTNTPSRPSQGTEGSGQVVAKVPVGRSPTDIAVGQGSVWVSVPAHGPEAAPVVVRIDPQRNQVVDRISLQGEAGYLQHIVAGEGGIWGISATGIDPDIERVLVRIDTTSGEVSGSLPDIAAPLAVGSEAVWAVQNGSIVRIDPASARVSSSVPVDGAVDAIAVGEGAVWALARNGDPPEASLLRIDPEANEIVASIELPGDVAPGPLAVGRGAVWVPRGIRGALKVKIESNQIEAEINQCCPFAVAEDGLWLIDGARVFLLNPDDGEVAASVSLDQAPAETLGRAVLDPGSAAIWVLNHENSVTRIELK